MPKHQFSSCSHKGHGSYCKRCEQGETISEFAKELQSKAPSFLNPNKKQPAVPVVLPSNVSVEDDGYVVRVGGHRFSLTEKTLQKCLTEMAETSRRLLARNVKKTDTSATAPTV